MSQNAFSRVAGPYQLITNNIHAEVQADLS